MKDIHKKMFSRFVRRVFYGMLVAGLYAVVAASVLAQNPPTERTTGVGGAASRATPPAGSQGLSNPLGNVNTFRDLIAKILDALVQIAIPVAVLVIVYSGFLFVTARGDEKKLETAKASLFWTVIGLGVLIGADIIANAVQNTVGLLN